MNAGFQYGTSTVLPMTLASLASSATAGWSSAVVDNSVDKFMDVMIQLKFRLVTGTPSVDQAVYLYCFGSEDGTNFPDGNPATSAAFTMRSGTCMTLLQFIPASTAGGLVYVGQPVTMAVGYGGIIPRKWGIFVKNTTGLAFTASAAENEVRYTGLTVLNQ